MNIDDYISSGIIEQYVMGLCSAEEENEVIILRRQHNAVNEAIINFETALETKMMTGVVLPDDATDKRIIETIKSLGQPVAITNNKSNIVIYYNWFKGVAAAAIILLGLSAIFNYSLFYKNKKLAQQLAVDNTKPVTLPVADYNILRNPAITPVAMYGVGYHAICRCTMFWDKKTGKVYIMIHHLPLSSATKDYQLWAVVNNRPVSIGIINDAIRDRFIELPNVPAGANAFSVTLEKAGGSVTPTQEEEYLSGKI
jgi:anti-sigma-K factor RskA